MKYIFILFISSFLANAQIKTDQLNLMPWPQNIKLTDGTFALDKDFKVNITGNTNSRIFIGATRFLRRLDGRAGLFLTKDLLEQCNSKNHADVELAVYNSLKKLIQA